jgi:hypothetical protein
LLPEILANAEEGSDNREVFKALKEGLVFSSRGRLAVIIHQRRGYLGEWANADKIDLLVLLLNFRIVRRKVKLLEIDALERSDGVDEHPTSDTLP